MDAPAISIVIVNWNAAAHLRACLESLEAQVQGHAEVVVVENASTDGSAGMVRRDFPWAVLLEQHRNVGFAEGCNLGIGSARAPWIATLNNDATVARDWVEVVRAAIRHAPPRLGMVQCRMLFASDRSRINSTGVCLFPDGCAEDRDYGAPETHGSSEQDIFCPTAGAALYRRSMLDEVKLETGWFDKEFFLYGEDVDLGWRCRLAGWDAVYMPAATVFHDAHATTGRKGWRFVKTQCAKNRLRTLVKNASGRFIGRSAGQTLLDLLRIPGMGGPRALADALAGAMRSARLRSAVGRLSRIARVELERRWVTSRPSPPARPGRPIGTPHR